MAFGSSSLRSLAAAVLCLGLAAITSGPIRAAGTLTLHRGVNIHHALNWADLESRASGRYVFPPYQDRTHKLTPEDIATIKSAGFDFVRLTIDPGPLLQFQGKKLDKVYEILFDRVELILNAGLACIVDIHPNTQNALYAPEHLVGSLAPTYRDAIAKFAKALADKNYQNVALELMNEPRIGGDRAGDAAWQNQVEALYDAVRRQAPELSLIVPGAYEGSPEELQKLDASHFAADEHAVFTFHYYDPYQFTSQGLGTFEYMSDIPYPASRVSITAPLGASKDFIFGQDISVASKLRALATTSYLIERYYAMGFDRDTIRKTFDDIKAWAAKYNVPASRVLMGEFGAVRTGSGIRGAPDADRERWLTDVREEAESHGFPWAIWVYKGNGGRDIANRDGTYGIDPLTIRALGLKCMSAECSR